MSFPLPVHVLPCLGDKIASHPIATHSHAPILHFLWSILESVQEEKRMHASGTHAQTRRTLSLSSAHIRKHTHT